MRLNIKKLDDKAVIPSYAMHGDAGMDLTCISTVINDYGLVIYHTGLAVEIPRGCTGLIFPRSSICNYDLEMTNSVGVVDSGYRGEIIIKFRKTSKTPVIYKDSDRVAQLLIVPYMRVDIVETNKLSDTERGKGAYGSTGK